MNFDKKRIFVSSVAQDARDTALKHGLGLEIAEFCTAANLDTSDEAPAYLTATGLDFEGFDHWDRVVREKLEGIENRMFHAPFNELCPAAIDPLVYDITRRRYRQAAKAARTYGAKRMVVHSGYVPLIYFKGYFQERSIIFWREFLQELPEDFTLLLENVMEDEPHLLTEIVKEVADPRFRLCLDIGHANHKASARPVSEWIEVTSPYIGHLHIHNNYRDYDDHNPINDGIMDPHAAISKLWELCRPDTTCSIESLRAMPTADWLAENNYI